tara:strand:- start:1474 stop:1980 length:507 start_codon:yes stop_codon:yes gene_type:complete
MKRTMTGGVDSVRVVNLPTGMKDGGDLSVPPPKSLQMFEGFKAGPNQFMLQEEETVIPSEPNVQPRTMDQQGGFFPRPEIKGPIPSEPDIISTPYMDRATEGTTMRERFMYGPVINPREVYPMDPDPGIMGIPPNPNMPQGIGGVPNLLQANMLKPAGILDIKKVYDI